MKEQKKDNQTTEEANNYPLLGERVVLEEASIGLSIEMTSKVIPADDLLKMVMKTRDQIRMTKQNNKPPVGVG